MTSSTERQQRKKVIDAARASVRLESFVLDTEVESIYAQFSEGQIDSPKMMLKAKQHAGLSGRTFCGGINQSIESSIKALFYFCRIDLSLILHTQSSPQWLAYQVFYKSIFMFLWNELAAQNLRRISHRLTVRKPAASNASQRWRHSAEQLT